MVEGSSKDITILMPVNFSVEEAEKFRIEAIDDIKDGNNKLILDFKNCTFIDSTGLGVLVAIYKKCAEKNGYLKLKNLDNQVLKVFKLTRLDKVFDIL
ncbi:STAS domain-containing protein [Clostridium cellulovorans]|uniref:Anti-sigma factor antagonist n=1 Tax=Clostridium cellulovorans (strain ATCC 35296 / DSM 3052 / OCM 3 / 743B) TaxID=573061 RepID=D9SRW0_CLOC7|nr:STAS domain-containing protein [Clostridium cellulovorans]ADL50477.1 Sulfate transporter/antisigma-factor antagonist STAS [Clostridium cellulovorans 743B]